VRILLTVLFIAGTLAFAVQAADKAETGKSDTLKAKAADTAAVKLKPQQTCPIMGDPIDKKLFVDYKGKRIYVCMASCIPTLKKDPEKYIKKLESMGEGVETIGAGVKKQAGVVESGYYVCPMHPEERSAKPGRCPKCGMNLEFRKDVKDTTKAKAVNHEKMKM